MNRLWHVSICIAFFLAFTKNSLGREISISAAINKNPVTIEEIVKLTVTVNGVRQSPTPQLMDLSGFSVQSQSTSSSVRIINGTMTSSVSYIYLLRPQQIGQFKWKAVKVKIDGKIYKSNPLSITVQTHTAKDSKPNPYAFARLLVSNSKPFVNEQTILTFKLYRRIDAKNINLDLSLDAFRNRKLGKGREYSEVHNGLRYIVHELNTVLLSLKPGSFQVGPAKVELDLLFQNNNLRTRSPFDQFFNDPFFNRGRRAEHKVLRTNPVSIDVQAYPQIEKSKHFQGLTGHFNIQASIRKSELEAGETTTLTVYVRGIGNFENAEIPSPKLDDNFKVYPDKPQFKESISSRGISGEKIFKFALVPLKPGNHKIPSISLTFFDPELKKYQTIQTNPLSINVITPQKIEQLKITSSSNMSAIASDIKILGKDILPNHDELHDFNNHELTNSSLFFYGFGLITPPIFCFSLFFFIKYKRKIEQNSGFSRARRAFKNAHEKLNYLKSMTEDDPKTLARSLSQALREYIGNKHNLAGTAFTSLEVELKMIERGYSKNEIEKTGKYLNKCETLQYGMTVNVSPKELIEEYLQILTQLEKCLLK